MLAFDAEQRSVAELDRAARSLGVPLTIVRDRYDGERELYEHRWILVRPDQYVAWAADAPPTDASGLLRHVAGSG